MILSDLITILFVPCYEINIKKITFRLKLNNLINDEVIEKYYIKFKNSSNCEIKRELRIKKKKTLLYLQSIIIVHDRNKRWMIAASKIILSSPIRFFVPTTRKSLRAPSIVK